MNWFNKLRRYIIIKTAESYYNRMMAQCNELYGKTHRHHYIIIDPFKGKRITITNRANFRATKRAINDSGARNTVRYGEGYVSHDTMTDVHNGCFYSTLLKYELDRLLRKPEENARYIKHVTNDIEARRRAYIKWTLENARIRKGLFARLAERRKRRQENRIVRKELESMKNKKPTANP